MKMMGKEVFALALFACVLKVSNAVSCTTATASTCATTLYVTGTCSSSVCACATDFSAVETGCGRTSNIPVETPTITAGADNEFSGEVLNGETLDLSCSHSYTSGVTYKWYVDGTVDTSATSQTLTVTVNAVDFSKSYECQITFSSDDSAKSAAFAVTGYGTSGTITKTPVISGMPQVVTQTDNSATLVCGNLPKDNPTTVTFLSGTLAAGTDNPKTIAVTSFSQAITCTVSVGSGATISSGTSAAVTTPSAAANALPITEADVKIVPTEPVVSGYMAIRCLVTADSLTSLTYSWTYDSNPIAGQEDHTLQVNSLTDATHGNAKVYGCAAMLSGISSAAASGTLTIAELSSKTPTISSDKTTTDFGLGTSYTLTCTSNSETPGMTYEWTKAGTVQSTTSQTLSITATSTSTAYTCKLKLGSASSSASSALTVVGANVLAVSIDGPSKPVSGQSVTFTCQVTKGASSAAPTYVWKRAGSAISGETSSTYTVASPTSSIDGALTCEATIGSDAAVASNAVTVAVTATPDAPTLTGATTIKNSGSYTLTCTSSSHVTAAVYEWKFTPSGGSETTLSSTSSTYTISSAASGNAGAYTCKVTVGSQASAVSNTLTATYEATKGLSCTGVSTCSADLTSYTGNCIGGICECASSATLMADGCQTNGAKQKIGSGLLLTIGLLVLRLL